MGIFSDNSKNDQLQYLEEERKKLWQKITDLEKRIDRSTSEDIKDARQALKKTTEYRNKAKDRLDYSINLNQQTEDLFNKTSQIFTENIVIKDNIKKQEDLTNELVQKIEMKVNSFGDKITIIDNTLEKYPDLESQIVQIDNLIQSANDGNTKISTLHKNLISKKNEIDEFHNNVFGYEENDEQTGELIRVEGLKDDLESQYGDLLARIEDAESKLDIIKSSSIEKYDIFLLEESSKNVKQQDLWENKLSGIEEQITNLLPKALTAGLSSAFVKKKQEEENLYEEYKKNFKIGIRWISFSALLPIGISIFYLFTENATIIDTIERAPKIMLAFLPLYIPLVWTTISANKKVNLSKRLIEEYSHKQVLSMTIEGLSKQIENIDDSDMSEELRVKLLNSFLNVTSENPGKLILNYQKSDNPLLNYFDRDKKKEKTIVDTVKERTKDIIDSAVDEIEEGISKNGKL